MGKFELLKNGILLLTLIFVSNVIFAQQIRFNVNYTIEDGSILWDINETDSGYNAIGNSGISPNYSLSYAGIYYLYLPGSRRNLCVKFDKFGNLIQEYQYKYQNDWLFSEQAHFCMTYSKEFISCGTMNSQPSAQMQYAGLIVKYDYDLDTLWTRTYFQQDQYLTFWDCVEAPDHGYVVAGTRYTSNINSNDIMIMKIDNNGNYQWQNIVSSPGVDYGLKIINTFDKGYLIYGQKDFFNNRNPYIVKFDSSGSFIWDRTFGNPNISDGMSLNGLISTKDSNYVIASDFGVHETVNGTDTFCGYLVKFNDSGNIIWEKKYKNNLRIYLFNSLAELDNSDMIVVGLKDSGSGYFVDGELVKLTPDGEILWKRTINDNEISPSIYECSLMSIKKTADGGYAMAGWLFIDTINPLPLYRMWFVKTDSMGCDGVNSCIDTALAFTTRYSQDIVFEGDSVLVMVDINNGNGPFSALLPDSNILNPLYIFRDSCSFGFYAHPTVQYNHLPLTVFNNYTQTVTDTLYFYVLPNNDISRLDANNYKVNISPNPASNQVTFELSPQIKSEIKITIFNSYGQAIADYHTLNSSLLLDVRSYSNGVYYLRINSQYITLVKKFVIFK